MASVISKNESAHKFAVEVKDVPVQFMNALRRILLNETPAVEVQDVVIHTNTTAMPHEMLRHRIEMLPLNVRPTEDEVVLKSKIELRIGLEDQDVRNVTTDDFVVNSSRPDILMKDRDLGTPLFVLRTRKGESVHIEARLGINQNGTHVSTATYGYHLDPERVEADRKTYVAENLNVPDAAQVFNNSYIQRSYSRNEKGRPNWFDFSVETIGVIPAKELFQMSVQILKTRVKRWSDTVKDKIVRSAEPGVYTFVSSEGHTLGSLLQCIVYEEPGLVSVVDYDVPHPLREEMRLRVLTSRNPEEIVDFCVAKVNQYCSLLEKEI